MSDSKRGKAREREKVEEGEEEEEEREREKEKERGEEKKTDETISLTDSVWIRAACPTGTTGLSLALHLLRTSINSE